MRLADKKILLGVCGSIAAYKAALIVRLLIKQGCEVKVILTEDAKDFITPLTLSTLSKNDVYSAFVADEESGRWSNHVDLGLWADAFVIAPATANSISKLASGRADNLLIATYLSARCPVFIAPAMDLDMWAHSSTQRNIGLLQEYGNMVIDVEDGELASGLEGKGRMAEPEQIVKTLEEAFVSGNTKSLEGKQVLISAGPTKEALDPVRFISNHSTGRMGIELAKACVKAGAEVTLVLGPSALHPPKNITTINVVSAADMAEAMFSRFSKTDITIMSAAVADYTPVTKAEGKIKKKDGNLNIELKRTTDILRTLGEQKKGNQILVGFALETDNEIENAKGKLKKKNLDVIVLNSLKDSGAGFAHSTNKITLIDKHNNITKFELKSKQAVAHDIIEAISDFPVIHHA